VYYFRVRYDQSCSNSSSSSSSTCSADSDGKVTVIRFMVTAMKAINRGGISICLQRNKGKVIVVCSEQNVNSEDKEL